MAVPYPLERVAVCNVYNAELITAVGAIDKIVGVDNYIFKDQSGFKNRFNETQVFGISQNAMNYEKLAELAPQAVIITGEGTWRDAQEMLDRFGIKVIVINSYYTDQFADNCRLIGRIFGREEQAEELVNYFNDKLAYIKASPAEVCILNIGLLEKQQCRAIIFIKWLNIQALIIFLPLLKDRRLIRKR